MAQSLARLHVHLIFSTKNHTPWLREEIRSELHAYLGAVLNHLRCTPGLINSVDDHVHLLC